MGTALTPDSKISLALVITVLVTTGGLVYRAGALSHNVDQVVREVKDLRLQLARMEGRVARLEVIAAIASERWSRTQDPKEPGKMYAPYP